MGSHTVRKTVGTGRQALCRFETAIIVKLFVLALATNVRFL